ncbi:MAG: ABC transporter ATP-binding protein [Spirochaetes bacterium]|nr:ABC transporter ATP-binding protein [Spirochaetota bacterium]
MTGLSIKGISKSFGAIQALDDVSFDIKKGRIHGIIGPNGSGKTTLFNCITGLLKPDKGVVTYGTYKITGLNPESIANMGIRRTFQAGKVVTGLTVLENIMMGIFDFKAKDYADTFLRLPFRKSSRETEIRERAKEALKIIGMENDEERWGADLVWAERQFVQIARAMISEPGMLLLDEPNSGMGAQETGLIENIIARVSKMGVTVVVISHDVKMLMNLSDWVTVLNFGEKIAEGTPEEVQKNQRVLEAYLGTE